jgi:bifunctional DNA-binding transcriptional regulator/antitoxin component of YhaV-PrlF toxin-antitoxin module
MAMSVKLGPDGRLLVPNELRRAFGAAPGEPLVARLEAGRLVVERRRDVVRRLQDRFATVPSDVDLAEELIAERRSEVEREGT